MLGVLGIDDLAGVRLAVDAGDVGLGGHPEVRPSVLGIAPLLDAGKEAFGARAIALNREVTIGAVPVAPAIGAVGHLGRHQVLGAREEMDVGLLGVVVAGNPLVGLARHRRQPEAEAQAERAIAGPGVVLHRQVRLQAAGG